LKQTRIYSKIPGRLHQAPAVQLAQELKSIPVDWAVGLHRKRDEFTPWRESSILDHLIIIITLAAILETLSQHYRCRHTLHWKLVTLTWRSEKFGL